AMRLTGQGKSKVLMASLDTRRPAAMEQLAVLGQQVGVQTLPIVAGQTPPQIARRALEAGRLGGFDVVMFDTAGRTTLDEEMMAEAANVKQAASPHEVLLVADALTGQDAVNLARAFDERVGLTGIVLTRVDGDGRGGAALSMRAVTNRPIKLIGTGEKLDALEEFDPARIAGRIRGMADMMKAMGSGKRSPLAGLGQMMGFGSGAPSPEQMAELAKKMPGGMPGAGAGGNPGSLPPTMPKLPQGLPTNIPGLSGLGS